MNNILKIVFIIIGTFIGAGFASGKEIYLFFYSYGYKGLFGILLCSILIGIIIFKILKKIKKNNINNYQEFLNIIINLKNKKKYLNIKFIINNIINIFLLITFYIMIAGFGALLYQEYKIPQIIGGSFLSIICFFTFITNIKGVVKINQIITPILCIFLFIIGIIDLTQNENIIFKNNLLINYKLFDNKKWIIDSILYCSYNSILLIPILTNLKKYINNEKNIFLISLFTTLIILILSTIVYFLVINISQNIESVEMPAVFAVGLISEFLKKIYIIIILFAIYTTTIILGISFLKNITQNKKNYFYISTIMCFSGIIMSNFGFSNLINLLYPIFGYLGLLQIYLILKS